MEENIRCAEKNGIRRRRRDIRRVIERLVICRDNDNGVLRPTSINVCDEEADNSNLGDGNLADGGDIEGDNFLSTKLFLSDKTNICAYFDSKLS